MKALFTSNYGEEKMDQIAKLGYEVLIVKEKDITYTDEMYDVEVMVCYDPFDNLDINKMPKLKWIQLASVGIDQIPYNLLNKRDIIVTNNKGGYSIPMGEWVVLKMLEVYKKTHELYKQQKQKQWKVNRHVLELYRKKIGFIGTGSIAIESAKRLQGFEAHVVGVNTQGAKVQYFDKCYPMDKLEEVLRVCDVVVVTIPYTEKTHHLIGEKEFKAMKSNAVFINVSRGSIVNEESLIKHLKENNNMVASLDVFEREPLAADSQLWEMENVIITPHNSWVSEMRDERRFRIVYENMKRYKESEELINKVDITKGY